MINAETNGKHERPTVAVLGLGIMGLPFAFNLANAGFPVKAYNRRTGPRKVLAAEGISTTDTPESAVEGADVVITMLSTPDVTLDVVKRALPAIGPGAAVVQMGTIGIEGVESLEQILAGRDDVHLIDAPVSGTKGPAERGEIIVLASGADKDSDIALRQAVDEVFDVLGKRTVWLGPAGQGTRMKLVVNGFLVTMMQGTAEMAALGESFGFSLSELRGALEGGPLASPYAMMKLDKLINDDYATEMSLKWGAKDAALALQANDRTGRALLPALEAATQCWDSAAAEGLGEEDIAAVYRTLRSAERVAG